MQRTQDKEEVDDEKEDADEKVKKLGNKRGKISFRLICNYTYHSPSDFRLTFSLSHSLIQIHTQTCARSLCFAQFHSLFLAPVFFVLFPASFARAISFTRSRSHFRSFYVCVFFRLFSQ